MRTINIPNKEVATSVEFVERLARLAANRQVKLLTVQRKDRKAA